MKPRMLVLAVGAAALTACDGSTAPRTFTTLASLDQLRATFNADSGKVRAIFLASPT